MKKTRNASLTLREVYACWTAVCSGSPYHQKKIYTGVLKKKLFKLMSKEELQRARKEYDI